MISHLDDEQASAAVDGEATADELAHLEACETCRARFDAFRGVAAIVGVNVAPDATAREAAVSAAMAPEAPHIAPVRRPRRMAWVAAAAAVVFGLAVAVPLLRSGRTSKSTTALRPSSGAETTQGAAGGVAATELGDQSDPAVLAALVRQRLGGASNGASNAVSGGAPKSVSQSGTTAAQRFDAAGAGGPCISEAAAAAGHPPSELRYQATLTWNGRPAVVMVFGADPHPAGIVIAPPVTAQPTCEVLARLPL